MKKKNKAKLIKFWELSILIFHLDTFMSSYTAAGERSEDEKAPHR